MKKKGKNSGKKVCLKNAFNHKKLNNKKLIILDFVRLFNNFNKTQTILSSPVRSVLSLFIS